MISFSSLRDRPTVAEMSANSESLAPAAASLEGEPPMVDLTSLPTAKACTSNAFATMFRMARAQCSSGGSNSQQPAQSSVSSEAEHSAPPLASVERDRVVLQKRPAERRNAVAGEHKRAPTSVTASERVRQYPGEMLTVSKGELFCLACKSQIRAAAASGVVIPSADIDAFTKGVLAWWRANALTLACLVTCGSNCLCALSKFSFMRARILLARKHVRRCTNTSHGRLLAGSTHVEV